jgi:hypothetical protein
MQPPPTLNDAMSNAPLFGLPDTAITRALSGVFSPDIMPVAGQPVGGISLADMIPRSKLDVALTAASILPVGKIVKGIKNVKEAQRAVSLAREAETVPTLEKFRAAGERQPSLQSDSVRLYRGHEVGESPTTSLEGNWWTPNQEHAEQVALDRMEGKRQLSYVDIPKGDLEKYSAFNHPDASRMIGPGEDPYILPQHISAARKPLYRHHIKAN